MLSYELNCIYGSKKKYGDFEGQEYLTAHVRGLKLITKNKIKLAIYV
jgi:hypothetical protein